MVDSNENSHTDSRRWANRLKIRSAEDSLGFLMWKTTNAFMRAVDEALRDEGMTHTQLVILASSAVEGERKSFVTQREIAHREGLDEGLVSQIVKKLESKNLIKRIVDRSDARIRLLSVTRRGYAELDRLMPILESTHELFFSRLGKDMREFRKLLLSLAPKRE